MIEAWFDGVCEPVNPGGHAAWGALCKVDGVVVYADGGYVGSGPKMSNNVSEYCGFVAAITQVAKYPGPAIIRGDSALVINHLLGKWKMNGAGDWSHPPMLYYPFYLEAKKLFAIERERLMLKWVPRDQNSECDVLSKAVLNDRGIVFCIQPEPSQKQKRRA
jgi:ribonuclease HI